MISKLVRLHRRGLLGLAVKGEAGRRISWLGEKIGSPALIFNYYTYLAFHRGALETAPYTVDGIVQLYPALREICDLGSGTGVYMDEFRKRGVQSEGYEYSATARSIAKENFGLEVRPFDIANFGGSGRTYDACVSIEIAHYLPPVLGDRLVAICAESAPVVIFSAAHPGQGGSGHVNGQPRSYWIERFARHDMYRDEAKTAFLERHLRDNLVRGLWLADNILVFERGRGVDVMRSESAERQCQ